MGFFSKLFGKKEEEDKSFAGLEQFPENQPTAQDELGLGEKPAMPETQPEFGPEHPLAPNLPKPQISPRDIELLNSKLDTLKAILNSMDQRIANLERAAGVEQKKMPW